MAGKRTFEGLENKEGNIGYENEGDHLFSRFPFNSILGIAP